MFELHCRSRYRFRFVVGGHSTSLPMRRLLVIRPLSALARNSEDESRGPPPEQHSTTAYRMHDAHPSLRLRGRLQTSCSLAAPSAQPGDKLNKHIYIYIYMCIYICLSLSLPLSLYIYIYIYICTCRYICIGTLGTRSRLRSLESLKPRVSASRDGIPYYTVLYCSILLYYSKSYPYTYTYTIYIYIYIYMYRLSGGAA